MEMIRIAEVREMKDDVARMYLGGMSTTDVARAINAWPKIVHTVLKENNVKTRSQSEAGRLIFVKGDSAGRYRRIAWEMKPRVCENCGSTDNLCVHHKDRDRANNTAENLQILCKPCHTTLHYDLGHLGLPPRGKTVTPEHKMEYMKKWRSEHKAEILEYNRAYGKMRREKKRYNALTGEVVK